MQHENPNFHTLFFDLMSASVGDVSNSTKKYKNWWKRNETNDNKQHQVRSLNESNRIRTIIVENDS